MSSWRPTRHPVVSRVKRLLHQYRSRHARGGRKAVRSRAAHFRPEAERLFNALSEKAEICMPFAETFWALRFASAGGSIPACRGWSIARKRPDPISAPTPNAGPELVITRTFRAPRELECVRKLGSAGVRVAWAHAFDNTLQRLILRAVLRNIGPMVVRPSTPHGPRTYVIFDFHTLTERT